jgi:glycosyl transferase family 2
MPGASEAETPALSSSGVRTGSSRHLEATVTSSAHADSSAWYRRHGVFLAILCGGVALRILVLFAFGPAFLVKESGSYLSFLRTLTPDSAHPAGYALLELTPLSWFSSSLGLVVAVQHLLGLATGIGLYVLLLRWGVWRWLSAVAAIPALWAPYQVASEHLVLPDTLFLFLVVMALLALSWRARPSMAAVLGAGLLLGVATTVRGAAWPLVVVALVFAFLAGANRRRRVAGALVVLVGFGVAVVPYAAWYHHTHHVYAIPDSPAADPSAPTTPASSAQSHGALDGFSMLFDWAHPGSSSFGDIRHWQFRTYVPPATSPTLERLYAQHGAEQLEARQPAANALATYQEHGFVPGALLFTCLLLGVLGGIGVGRAGASRMRVVCLLNALFPVALLLGTVGATELSWRDQIPSLVLLPTVGALGFTALLRGRRGAAASRPQIDAVDRAALSDFQGTYGRPRLAPVVVVIAAYNEASGLPLVLSKIPSEVSGLQTDVVVVDDGSTDSTAQAAAGRPGVYLVRCPTNRGQGAAMRLGYRIARDHGALYIITTDADGQYDTADFPVVLGPLLDGTADFVTGSRRLGHQHTNDRLRRAGVHVFAWIVSALTGQWLTDTSFGLRAMRAEVTGAVTLNQPQYQSSELLLGVHSHGYRVTEVPGTMHLRAEGSTKKGGNMVYGSRYARVVFGTWWREGCPAPAAAAAPALGVAGSPAGGSTTPEG